MEKTSLSIIQLKIADALNHLKERAKFTEAILAKSVRIGGKIDGKNKAGISLSDLEKALDYVESNNIAFFELHLNSENEFMLLKSETSKRLDQEAKHRRNASEKSMILFSNSDVNEKTDSKKVKDLKKMKKIRTKSEKINIYSNFEDLD